MSLTLAQYESPWGKFLLLPLSLLLLLFSHLINALSVVLDFPSSFSLKESSSVVHREHPAKELYPDPTLSTECTSRKLDSWSIAFELHILFKSFKSARSSDVSGRELPTPGSGQAFERTAWCRVESFRKKLQAGSSRAISRYLHQVKPQKLRRCKDFLSKIYRFQVSSLCFWMS